LWLNFNKTKNSELKMGKTTVLKVFKKTINSNQKKVATFHIFVVFNNKI